MQQIDFTKFRNNKVALVHNGIQVGSNTFRHDKTLDCGAPIGTVDVRDLIGAAQTHQALSGTCHAQFAALVFTATGSWRALDWYVPLVATLSDQEIVDFYQLVYNIAWNENFDLRLYDARNAQPVIPGDTLAIIAAHLAEIFFFRRDILDRLLAAPRRIWLYATPDAYKRAGGVAGGCYRGDLGAVQLVLSRVYEGFGGQQVGASPFLHEFGHMLDFFESARACQGRSEGLLPGFSPADGSIFTPRARELFIQGKRLELQRYQRRFTVRSGEEDAIPIGHPYVFQNDTEFAAGYLEMFFRNPNYFASQNPTLYQSYVELLRQDPRNAWPTDYMHYVSDNRWFYLQSGEQPWPTRLTIPEK